ncbi:MAG: hypothetical protein LBG86_01145 [Puniceicoccales bacterium]|jgi:hypothetical protein|nr:hypothetical protein [Puniceicoccales bacterium]
MKGATVAVLAAGVGNRYGGLKQFEKFGTGRHCILEYSLFFAYRHGFRRAVFIVQKLQRESVEQHFSSLRRCMEIQFVEQDLFDVPKGAVIPPGRRKPWGTAHALYALRHTLRGPFVLINGDDLYGDEAWHKMAHLMKSYPHDSGMVAYRLRCTLPKEGSVCRGICTIRDGHLRKIREYFQLKHFQGKIMDEKTGKCFHGSEPTSMNFWYFNESIFTMLSTSYGEFFFRDKTALMGEEWILPAVIDQCISKGQLTIHVSVTDAPWVGLTNRIDAMFMEQHIDQLNRDGHYAKDLWGSLPSHPISRTIS